MKILSYVGLGIVTGILLMGCGDDRSHGSDDASSGSAKWAYETAIGKKMVEKKFAYIPGGFDVDGDGALEAGFWLSLYEAKRDANQTLQSTNSSASVDALMRANFKVYSETSTKFDASLPTSSGFLDALSSSVEAFNALRVNFVEAGDAVNRISALEAVVSLENSQIEGGVPIGLPSEKQWMQVVKLVINNPKNWTSGKVGEGKLFQGSTATGVSQRFFVIENSLLGTDAYVPKNYTVNVYDLSGNVSEWTSGLVKADERFLTGASLQKEFNEVNNAPQWWKPILAGRDVSLGSSQGAGQYHDGSARAGANDTLAITNKGTGDVSDYAAVARGGSNSIDDENLVGVGAAMLTYGAGYKGPTVGFRAASAYLY